MSLRKIVVFGVTGNQGASVARALLDDATQKFDVWGVTRNPDSKSSQEMAKLGVNLVKGDLDDPSTYEDALKGADGAFINANFWQFYKGNNAHEAAEAEAKQSRGAIDACKRAGVKQTVYSTLESYKPRQELPHFDAKAEVTEHMKKIGLPSTQLYSSYFYDNVMLSKPYDKDGKTIIPLPMPDDTVLPSFSPAQIGLWVRVAFRDPEQWIGKDIVACADLITVAGIAEALSEISGKKFDTEHYTKEDFMALKDKMDGELWLNYLAFVNGEMKRDPVESRKLVPEAVDFKTWAKDSPKMAEKFGY